MFPITTALLAAIAVASTAQAAVHSLQTPGGQCLTGSTEAGSTPTFANCNVQNDQRSPTTQQQWIIAPGNNQGVQLFGTELCLDAGANPQSGRTAVLSPCSDSASQTWYLTDDNRIAITGGDQCLEAQASEATTQLCAPGVANQAWIPVFLFDEGSSSGGAVGGAAGSASSATSAAGSASGPLAGVTSSLSSAASAATNGASSAAASGASAAASGASAASSSVASGASAASSSVASGASAASSAVSAASSSASGAIASASSAISSASGAISSASGPLAGVASSLSSAASAASAAPTGGASVHTVGLPAAIGAFVAAMFL